MNRNRILCLSFTSLMFAGCAQDGSPDIEDRASSRLSAGQDGELRKQLQRGLDELHSNGVVGVVARVDDGGRRIHARSGSARKDSDRPVAFESHFRIGSATKTFVAVVMLQLVDEGKVRLEDSVDRWLPGVVSGHGNDGKKITIRNLLQHTSGLHNYTQDLLLEFKAKDYYAKRFQHSEPEDLLAIAVAHPPEFAPATSWRYSNTNYIVAGMIIEKATGRDWSTEVDRRILAPLRMWDTFEPGDWPGLPPPHAQGYNAFTAGEPLVDVSLMNMSFAGAAGSLIGTTEDLTRFWRALQGGELLSPARMADLHDTVPATELQAVIPGVRDGLGIFWAPTRCGGYWFHPGDAFGFATRDAVDEQGTRAMVLSSSSTSDVPGVTLARIEIELKVLEDVMCAGR